MGNKLNYLLQKWPKGTLATSLWLHELKISPSLTKKYKLNGWVEDMGHGVVKRGGDQVSWKGAIYSLQIQLHISLHVGGKTALEMQGLAHFIKFEQNTAHLYLSGNHKLPTWLLQNDWKTTFYIYRTQFINSSEGMVLHQLNDFAINISGPERAFLEVLFLVPNYQSLKECYYILENLISLRPQILQLLLENTKSVKVKRLFFFLADKINHPWLIQLDKSKVNFGTGKRQIYDNGIFDGKYMITVPKDLIDDN